jgi:hypothetical protein
MSRFRVPAVLLAGALLLLAPAPASAAGGITSPGVGVVVRADAVVPLRATVEGPAAEPSELSLQPPVGEAEVVAVSTGPDGGELAHDLDTSCASRVCTGRRPALNGTWTLRLSGGAQDERTFVLRIPPAVPAEVAAERSEGGVLIRWRQGDEPDLTGYDVLDARGRTVRGGVGLDACDAERTCRVEVPEEAGSWTVRAYRMACPDCTDLLASPASGAVRAAGAGVPAAPAVEAGPAPATRPSRPAAAPPAQGPSQREAFGRSFVLAGPAAPVPPAPVALPAPPPQADGPYGDTLGYGEREVALPSTGPPLSRASDAVGSLVGDGDRIRLMVLAGLMVAASVWLRRWTRRAVAD